MARWKLMTPHYLNVDDEEWEYQETDRQTGRPRRTKFRVPRLLDPRDPSSWTKRWGRKDDEDGEVIVCWEGKGDSTDIVFHGDPTPDMQPVDSEAEEISAGFAELWRYKPEGNETYSQSLIDRFQEQLAEKTSAAAEVPGLADLTSAIGKLVETNQKLIERRA